MADGVPPLQDSAAAPKSGQQVMTADSGQVVTVTASKASWGVFQNGKAIALADAVTSFEYMQDTRVSNFPQEDGAFQSYNKVGTPYESRVRLVKGGTEAQRKAFLDAIEKATSSTDTYDVVTPEKTYRNATLQKHSYRRTASAGATLVAVDLTLVQIRSTVAPRYTNAKTPSGADPKNVGTVQAQPAPASLSKAAN